MLLQVCVFCSRGGCLPQCMLGYHTPPGADTPQEQTPRSRHTPQEQTPPRSRHPRSRHPPPEQTPPGQKLPQPGTDTLPPGADTPWEETPQNRHPVEQTPTPQSRPPPMSRHTPPGKQTPSNPLLGSRLRHMVNERPVRILLKCILVFNCFHVWTADVIQVWNILFASVVGKSVTSIRRRNQPTNPMEFSRNTESCQCWHPCIG